MRSLRDILSSLGENPRVLAVFANGSSVAGTAVPKSDLDFTVIVAAKKDIPAILSSLKELLRFTGTEHEVPHFSYGGKTVAICIYDKRTVDFFVRALYASAEGLLAWQRVVQHKIVEAIPLRDPKDLLARYQRDASSYPSRLQREVFSRSLSALEEAYLEWGRHGFRNPFHFSHELPGILEQACIALYAKNRRLLMVPYKRLHRDLHSLRPDLSKELLFLVQGTNTHENLAQKRKMLGKAIRKLERAGFL